MGHHTHHHGQEHHHSHQHAGEDQAGTAESSLGDRDKLIRMLEHWLRHNDEHAQSYGRWADKARSLGEEEIQNLLQEMAGDARRQNQRLQSLIRKAAG